jgi:hypothetical protein
LKVRKDGMRGSLKRVGRKTGRRLERGRKWWKEKRNGRKTD